MKIRDLLVAGLFGLAAASGAQAAVAGVTVVCDDANTLGLREVTVDPAKSGTCKVGLQNLGDDALVDLVESLYGLTTPPDAELIERDAANSNGGDLTITGVGSGADDDPNSGTWSFTSSLWDDYERLFLWFHFGDAKDCDPTSGTCATDPDTFIVELARADSSGTWEFGCALETTCKLTGLSNVALVGWGDGPELIPEPASLALVGLGLIAVAATRRRRRA